MRNEQEWNQRGDAEWNQRGEAEWTFAESEWQGRAGDSEWH